MGSMTEAVESKCPFGCDDCPFDQKSRFNYCVTHFWYYIEHLLGLARSKNPGQRRFADRRLEEQESK